MCLRSTVRSIALETQAAWLYDRQRQLEGVAVARVTGFLPCSHFA